MVKTEQRPHTRTRISWRCGGCGGDGERWPLSDFGVGGSWFSLADLSKAIDARFESVLTAAQKRPDASTIRHRNLVVRPDGPRGPSRGLTGRHDAVGVRPTPDWRVGGAHPMVSSGALGGVALTNRGVIALRGGVIRRTVPAAVTAYSSRSRRQRARMRLFASRLGQPGVPERTKPVAGIFPCGRPGWRPVFRRRSRARYGAASSCRRRRFSARIAASGSSTA